MPSAAVRPLYAHREPPPRIISGAAPADEDARLLAGLLARSARIDPKFFYDDQGAALYGAITGLDEYHPAQLESEMFASHRPAIAAQIPRGAQWIDLGCGDAGKCAPWLDRSGARRYVGVDIARDGLRGAVARIGRDCPQVEALGVTADFTQPLQLHHLLDERTWPRVFFYPGSSIGNFDPPAALELLRSIRGHCGSSGQLLIALDFTRDPDTLNAAYDDALGVTAAFNRNVLRVVNRRLQADFEPRNFRHYVLFNEQEGRVEMQLIARREQLVSFNIVAGTERRFRAGEAILTECSYKYAPGQFAELLEWAGFRRHWLWTHVDGHYGAFLASA